MDQTRETQAVGAVLGSGARWLADAIEARGNSSSTCDFQAFSLLKRRFDLHRVLL